MHNLDIQVEKRDEDSSLMQLKEEVSVHVVWVLCGCVSNNVKSWVGMCMVLHRTLS